MGGIDMSTQRLATHTSSPTPSTQSWALRIPLVILEVFVGLGGVFGGIEMVRHPLNPMGVTTELIQGTPFSTFTWPGVLLLTLLGIAPLVLAIGVLARMRRAVPLSGAFGVVLIAWIGVQWVMLTDRLWLQPLMFGIGLGILGLSAVLYRRDTQ
jgi:hypothetical protein